MALLTKVPLYQNALILPVVSQSMRKIHLGCKANKITRYTIPNFALYLPIIVNNNYANSVVVCSK